MPGRGLQHGDLGVLGAHQGDVRLLEDRQDQGAAAHGCAALVARFRRSGPAPLPGGAGQRCGNHTPQPMVEAGSDQLHRGQASGGQPAQERQPPGAVLGDSRAQAQDLPLAAASTPVAVRACTLTCGRPRSPCG